MKTHCSTRIRRILFPILCIILLVGCAGHSTKHGDDEIQDLYQLEEQELPSQVDERPLLSVKQIRLETEYEIFYKVFVSKDQLYIMGRELGMEESDIANISVYTMDGDQLRTISVPNTKTNSLVDFFVDEDASIWTLHNRFSYVRDAERYEGSVLRCYNISGEIKEEIPVGPSKTAPNRILMDREHSVFYLFSLNSVAAYDYKGQERFRLESSRMLYGACLTEHQDVAVGAYTGDSVHVLVVDCENQSWSREVATSNTAVRIVYGSVGDYILCAANDDVYSLDLSTGECEFCFNWGEIGIYDEIYDVIPVSRDVYIVQSNTRLYRVQYENSKEIENRTLVLATFDTDLVAEDVISFNSMDIGYQIRIKDYSLYNSGEGDHTGVDRLILDIMAGNAPDLYDLRDMPLQQFVELGILEDLNPYLDRDPLIDRSAYNPTLLKAQETDGKLFYVMPHVSVLSLLCREEQIADGTPLSFQSILDAAGSSDPFGGMLTRYSFLWYALSGGEQSYIDWENHVCHFDSEEFRSILIIADRLPDTWSDVSREDSEKTGWIIAELLDPGLMINYTNALGGDVRTGECVVAAGIPSPDGVKYPICPTRYTWGMSSDSDVKDGAWLFIRFFLLEEYQNSNMIPLSMTALSDAEDAYANWIENNGQAYLINRWGEETDVVVDSMVFYDYFRTVVDSVTGVYNNDQVVFSIVWNEAQQYFAGDISIENVVKRIQSRVSIYISERG